MTLNLANYFATIRSLCLNIVKGWRTNCWHLSFDKTGLECDAVLHLQNGRYGLVEIKLGGETLIGEGLRTLKKFSALIAGKKMPAPAFRMVLTAIGDFTYSEDGILVCPLSALKP